MCRLIASVRDLLLFFSPLSFYVSFFFLILVIVQSRIYGDQSQREAVINLIN